MEVRHWQGIGRCLGGPGGRGANPGGGAGGADWLASDAADQLTCFAGTGPVLGHGDPNFANFLWYGTQTRIVDFEDSGPSCRAFELALLAEHISAWSEARLDADAFTSLFDFTPTEVTGLRHYRRLAALYWLLERKRNVRR
jgi:thiamine kinase-like enzyme